MSDERPTDPKEVLGNFAREYRSSSLPPPHLLMIGADSSKSLSLAQEFAAQIGVKFANGDSSTIRIQGDLTALVTISGVALIENIHLLRRNFAELLAQALSDGELGITIGAGPAARLHKFPLDKVTILASCPSRSECPSNLYRAFERILEIPPYSNEELLGKLTEEAWKDRISFATEAAELMVKCGEGRADLLLSRFRKIVPHLEQTKTTNRPYIYESELRTALKKARITIPTETSQNGRANLHDLSGQEFEAVIKSLLIKMGFQAETTEVTGDGGIDIVATLDKPFCGGRYLFQCKRYSESNLIGAPAIRDFFGAVTADRAVKGIFITTSDFTTQAKEFASQAGIELVNLGRLRQLFAENGVNQYL